MKKWRCTVCGEIVESEERPVQCPVCKVPGEKFVEVVEDDKTWAAEHVVGVASDAPEDIKAGLRDMFTGECTEVGMYLAMSRVAIREGYPEAGAFFEKAAIDEAWHAAHFAELLGEVLTDSTEKNLKLRADAEYGATQARADLAKKAKALNLDAIHDIVHEIGRDEARHGKAFAGLLKRYFGK
ncbi:MAG: NADH peroxidase [Clostridia bacterium]|nr:NADH peroxidase [Clostridia bacterium]